MRVVFLTWEYPPRVVGELSWLIQSQVERLRRRGLRIELVTISDTGYYVEEPAHGLRVTRVSSPSSPHSSLITWIVSINTEVARVVADLYHSGTEELVLHSHDWHFAPASTTLKRSLKIPWLASIYSLEQHRSLNPNSPLSSCIRTIEWHMVRDCDAVHVNSDWMRSEVRNILSFDGDVRVLDASSDIWEEEMLKLYRVLVRS
ncbi:MAG: glycosyltransferase [Nitrososphaerota archaeon]